jgi:hypothetical protein
MEYCMAAASSPFCASELLQQHIAKPRIGFVDPDRKHELFDVMVHEETYGWRELLCPTGRTRERS